MGSIKPEDLPVVMQDESVEVRMAEVGEMTVLWSRLRKGADFGPMFAHLPDGFCSCPHWGFMLKGKLKMRTAHGDEIYSAGEAFYWAPGHVPIALEDCESVDFSPTEALISSLAT
jgi:hypothetical protein